MADHRLRLTSQAGDEHASSSGAVVDPGPQGHTQDISNTRANAGRQVFTRADPG